MKFAELLVVLPCHGLDDFPVHADSTAADSLLDCWTAAWHPALIAAAESPPGWLPMDESPADFSGRLIVVPSVSAGLVAADLFERAREGGGLALRQTGDRSATVNAALAELDTSVHGASDELVADFFALGFCRLGVESLVREMRYATAIDELRFGNETVAAAHAACAGEESKAREHLGRAFGALNDARKFVYPVDTCLIDLTLVAESTLGEALRRQLDEATATNLLISGETLRRMAEREPETLSAVRAALDRGSAALVGGEDHEGELALVSLEMMKSQLTAGLAVYESLLGHRPKVFGRRRYGLSPALPGLLQKFGFFGAIHATLDDGRFPLGSDAKIHWQGLGGVGIETVARLPLDAALSETYLGLGRHWAQSMDHDHLATVFLAHWPGAASRWRDVLRRVAGWTNALGTWMTLDSYFSDVDVAGRTQPLKADDYRAPYLKQDVAAGGVDPISRFVRSRRDANEATAARTIETLRLALDRNRSAGAAVVDVAQSLDEFAAAIPRATAAPGYLLANPLSRPRRVVVETGEGRALLVDAPALGFAWTPAPSSTEPAGAAKSKRRGPASLAAGNRLVNEFFEVNIHESQGGVKSIRDLAVRGAVLGQQIAMRLPGRPDEADDEINYSTMVADSVEVVTAEPTMGAIESRGALIDSAGERLADFRQRTRIVAGSRLLTLDIELTPRVPLRADPWTSYCAARFAWANEDARLARGVTLARVETESRRLEAPDYVEIETDKSRVAILTGGLPYHSRIGDRRLDTLLIVRGETATRFSLGIAVGVSNPAAAALEFQMPALAAHDERGAPRGACSGWLFRVGASNVVVTALEPLASDRATAGFRARLLETLGRSGRFTLESAQPVSAARQVDFLGDPICELAIEDDKIVVEIGEWEWIEVEVAWASKAER